MYTITFHEPDYISANSDGIDSDRYIFKYTLEYDNEKQDNRIIISIPETYLATPRLWNYEKIYHLKVALLIAKDIIEQKIKEHNLRKNEDFQVTEAYLENHNFDINEIEYKFSFQLDVN